MRNIIMILILSFGLIAPAFAQDEPRVPQSVGEACYNEQVNTGQFLVETNNNLLKLVRGDAPGGHIPRGVVAKWENDVRDFMIRQGDPAFWEVTYKGGSYADCLALGKKIRARVLAYAKQIAQASYR